MTDIEIKSVEAKEIAIAKKKHYMYAYIGIAMGQCLLILQVNKRNIKKITQYQ